MKILAGVQMAEAKTQAFWEMTKDAPHLIISKQENGYLIAIPLKPENIHKMDGYMLADYVYLGELNINQAITIPPTSN